MRGADSKYFGSLEISSSTEFASLKMRFTNTADRLDIFAQFADRDSETGFARDPRLAVPGHDRFDRLLVDLWSIG